MPRFALALAVAAALLGAAPAEGARVLRWEVRSRFVDATKVELDQPAPRTQGSRLRVNVLLPDGYDGQRRFPVLYLLHGANGSPDDWLRGPVSPYDPAADLRRIVAIRPGSASTSTSCCRWWSAGCG